MHRFSLFRHLSFGVVLLATLLVTRSYPQAPPNGLDSSFGSGGKVVTAIGNGAGSYASLVQPDGKIVLAGYTDAVGAQRSFALTRYLPNGTLDLTFGVNGIVVSPAGTGLVSAFALVTQDDGKLIAGGGLELGSTNAWILARYNSDGSLDTSFGNGGIVSTSVGRYVNALLVEPDGKILAAGASNTTSSGLPIDFAIARYNPNGSSDTSFGNNGVVYADLGDNARDAALSIKRQADGKYVVAGYNYPSPLANFALIRLNSNGSLDTTFGINGRSLTPVGNFGDSFFNRAGMVLDGSGRIVLSGRGTDDSGLAGFVTARYNSDGFLDTSFGNGGKSIVRFGGETSIANAVTLQSDGRILIGGSGRMPGDSGSGYAIARLNPNGASDISFGNNGRIVTKFGLSSDSDSAYSIQVQADGKILAAGRFTGLGSLRYFSAARYLSGPTNLLQRPELTVSDATGNNNGFPEPGENVLLTIPLVNGTGTGATGVSLQIAGGGSANYGTIADAEIVSRQIAQTIPANAPCGGIITLNFNVNSSLGPTSFDRQILLGAPNLSLTENFDGVTAPSIPNGWTATTTQNGVNFVTSTTNPDSPLNSMFALDPTTVGGGVLELSIDSGPFQDLIAAGGTFSQNGYNGTLGANGVNNPLAGRSAWTGNSAGYLTTIAQLPASANGEYIHLRWRFGADDNTAAVGWHIDSISITGGGFVNSYSCSVQRQAPFDFDGDGKTDIGIFRPAPGEWWINRSSNGSTFALQFGASTDRIAPADYTGDGKADIAFFRPASGEWYVLRSEDFSFFALPFGTNGDVPVPADYDADGKADFAVFRPSSSTWFVQRSRDNGTTIQQFGVNGDKPVAADYDGDGRADIAIYRPSNAQWWINRSTAGVIAMTFGNSTDKPVQGDYTGDGKADVGFWREPTGEWFVLRSEDFSYYSVPFGTSGDIPTPGDYDGDGRHDTTVFRPSSATWFSQHSTAGTLIQQFGATGDRPIPNAFVP